MAGMYQAYPDYKDSGVNWLGNIPTSWNVLPIKTLAKIFSGATPKSGNKLFWDGDIPWVTPADLSKRTSPYISKGSRSITVDGYNSCGASLVPKNSVILSSRAPIGTLGFASNDLCTNQGCKSLVLKKSYVPKFLYYFLLSSTKQLNMLGRGTTFLEISSDALGSYKVASPSEIEQDKIANFLDHETAKIDTLIVKQQQLIKLLKEKRQAVISQAVTKGLNPDVPMRDSDVEWFDTMPSQWKIIELKFSAKDGRKTFTDGDWIESPYITSSGVRLLQTGNVGIGVFKEKGFRYVSKNTFKDLNCTEVKPGDVLICRLDGPVGRSCLAPDLGVKIITSVDNAILKPNDSFDPRYIVYLTNCTPWLEWIADLCRVGGGFRLRVSRTLLGDQQIPAPPIKEQTRIADELDALSHYSQKCMERCEDSIKLSQERRSALISAAVTGKIDVRNWLPTQEAINAC